MHPDGCGAERNMRGARNLRAFSLVDVLVSIAVIGVLMGLLLPTVSHVRESTRRIICQSNLRQVGMGVAQYADENRDELAPSVFYSPNLPDNGRELAQMMTLRLGLGSDPIARWDGLGHLYDSFQLRAPEIFYCPSHSGDHAFQEYRQDWAVDETEIVGNYHYRGVGPNGAKRLRSVEPVRAALVTDGLRTARDINHRGGMNVLRADLSISWFTDHGGDIENMLAGTTTGEGTVNLVMGQIWRRIDRTISGGGPLGGGQ